MGLQITSMADIFTIILVFLLKSISSGETTATPTEAMTLPAVVSQDKTAIRDTIKVEISREAVLVEAHRVLKLSNFVIDDRQPASIAVSNMGANADLARQSGVSQGVLKALMDVRARHDKEDKGNSHILVMADEQTPYSTLKVIMNTAAVAGYIDMQLIVLGADQ